jgi:hypothetical protein
MRSLRAVEYSLSCRAAETAASQSVAGIGAWRYGRVSRHCSMRRRVSSSVTGFEMHCAVAVIGPPHPRGLMDRQYQGRPDQFMQACRKDTNLLVPGGKWQMISLL